MTLNNPAPLSCQNIVSFDDNKTPNITAISGCNIGCRFYKCLISKLISGKTGTLPHFSTFSRLFLHRSISLIYCFLPLLKLAYTFTQYQFSAPLFAPRLFLTDSSPSTPNFSIRLKAVIAERLTSSAISR